MAKYSKVQFISWGVYTGPRKDSADKGISYAGKEDPVDDIEARVAFTEEAISTAATHADGDSSTLKIFMAPEFLYRGTKGAYVHDFIGGYDNKTKLTPDLEQFKSKYEEFKGLFDLLREKISGSKYENWVFVFGTAISASWPSGNNSNLSAAATIDNTALIQAGGSANAMVNYISRKHFTSYIDFISTNIPNQSVLTTNNIVKGQTVPLLPKQDLKGVNEGAATFTLEGICDNDGKEILFGVEVCLDHEWSYNEGVAAVKDKSGSIPVHNDYGRIKAANIKVRIQLVPSGGMELKKNSISLDTDDKKISYAFNCDGLNGIEGYGAQLIQATSGKDAWGTLLKVGDKPEAVKGVNAFAVKSILANTASTGDSNKKAVKVESDSSELWSNGKGFSGAGKIFIFDSKDLHAKP